MCCTEGKIFASLESIEKCPLEPGFSQRLLMITALNTVKIILFYIDLHMDKSVTFTGMCF